MSVIETQGTVVRRLFTRPDVHPFDDIEWETRDARIGNGAKVVFEQTGVEFPKSWSQNATNIVAQKYFRGQLGTEARERSVKQMVSRVARTITQWGLERGYFGDGPGQLHDVEHNPDLREHPAKVFLDELTYILVSQLAAFNSPVWFNVGFEEHPQCSACFILSVEDTMESILGWNTKEGNIFIGGSGSGINLSAIRASMEPLSKGGTASGPTSWMRGADAWAGTIKSGGKTRRAAKMVILDVDHPDIMEFVWCKALEEDKAEALRAAGFDMSIDGDGFTSIQYQNANNSVRVSDEFMQLVMDDSPEAWRVVWRTNGDVHDLIVTDKESGEQRKLTARDVMMDIAQAAWRCADPGVQYDDTINRWNTTPTWGPIKASNPCSEYMHVNDSACNLASINLMKYRRGDGSFDVERFLHTVDILFLAQEITVGTEDQPASSFPTEEIAVNARAGRQIGLGYANLGAYLMAGGMPYDSETGRGVAAAITALMNGRAYYRSAQIAAAMGPYQRYAADKDNHDRVMRMHRDASYQIPDGDVPDAELLAAARRVNDEMVELGAAAGYRNAQATVLAPTGTISFLMDCDTTGIEPDFSLVKYKELVGGGNMTIANRTVPQALSTLGYDDPTIDGIRQYVEDNGNIVDAPGLKPEHLPVFDVAVGERAISHMGHIKMMGAVQPFLSGAISKTVNMPETATPEDIADAYIQAWRLGVKALAIYRDGSKTAQALRTDAQAQGAALQTFSLLDDSLNRAEWVKSWAQAFYVHFNPDWEDQKDDQGRRRLPKTRPTITHAVDITDGERNSHRFFFHIGLFPDGTPGEIFAVADKHGSWLRGTMDQMCRSMSDSLKRGQTVAQFVKYYRFEKYEPHGFTNNPDITRAMSPTDYLAQFIGTVWMEDDDLQMHNIDTRAIRAAKAAALDAATAAPAPAVAGNGSGSGQVGAIAVLEVTAGVHTLPGPPCGYCGAMMRRTGSCYTCSSCGNNTGCG